jgi:hypothetical protein
MNLLSDSFNLFFATKNWGFVVTKCIRDQIELCSMAFTRGYEKLSGQFKVSNLELRFQNI